MKSVEMSKLKSKKTMDDKIKRINKNLRFTNNKHTINIKWGRIKKRNKQIEADVEILCAYKKV